MEITEAPHSRTRPVVRIHFQLLKCFGMPVCSVGHIPASDANTRNPPLHIPIFNKRLMERSVMEGEEDEC